MVKMDRGRELMEEKSTIAAVAALEPSVSLDVPGDNSTPFVPSASEGNQQQHQNRPYL